MKFQLVLVFTVALATSAFGRGFFERIASPRLRANSNKSQNPVPEGYLAHQLFELANRLSDAKMFPNFLPAYANWLYAVQRDLENIESGETTVDTSNMSPEQAAAIQEALDGLAKAVQGFRDAGTKVLEDLEGMNSSFQIPGTMAKHMSSTFQAIMGNFGVLLKNGAPEIVADFGKNLMTLPPALLKDLAASPLRFMALTMGQII